MQNVLESVREDLPFPETIRDYYPDLEPHTRVCIQYAIDVVALEEIHLAAMPWDSSPIRT